MYNYYIYTVLCYILGISQQKEADKRWGVLCDYIDKLPEDEKPKTFKAWVTVFRKCGYGVTKEYCEYDKPCNFAGNVYFIHCTLVFSKHLVDNLHNSIEPTQDECFAYT